MLGIERVNGYFTTLGMTVKSILPLMQQKVQNLHNYSSYISCDFSNPCTNFFRIATNKYLIADFIKFKIFPCKVQAGSDVHL